MPAASQKEILISILVQSDIYARVIVSSPLIPCSVDLVLYTGLKSTRGRGPKAAVIPDGAAC